MPKPAGGASRSSWGKALKEALWPKISTIRLAWAAAVAIAGAAGWTSQGQVTAFQVLVWFCLLLVIAVAGAIRALAVAEERRKPKMRLRVLDVSESKEKGVFTRTGLIQIANDSEVTLNDVRLVVAALDPEAGIALHAPLRPSSGYSTMLPPGGKTQFDVIQERWHGSGPDPTDFEVCFAGDTTRCTLERGTYRFLLRALASESLPADIGARIASEETILDQLVFVEDPSALTLER